MESVNTAPTVRFDPGSQEFAWHAYEHYAELREQSPVHRLLQTDGTEIWLITRYEDARAALADPRLSKDPRGVRTALEEAGLVSPVEPMKTGEADFSRRLPTPDILESDPPEHTRLRRLVSRAFTSRRIERMRPLIEDLADRLLNEMAGAEQVDLMDAYAYPIPVTVICGLLGVPASDGPRIRWWADQMLRTDVPDEGHAKPPELTFAEYVHELARAAAPQVQRDLAEDEQPSLLQALLAASEGEERLSIAEVVEMIVTLLNAGHETTANLIGNGTLALVTHPDQRDLLRRHPELLPNAVEELLRYDGPVERATFRFSLEPLDVGGVTIPAHRMVGVVLAAANHDPSRFKDPEQLDLTRPRPHHVGFGHGIHFCLGAPLARLEAQVAFGRLLSRFPNIELACPLADLRLRAAGYLVRGLRALPVRPHGIPHHQPRPSSLTAER